MRILKAELNELRAEFDRLLTASEDVEPKLVEDALRAIIEGLRISEIAPCRCNKQNKGTAITFARNCKGLFRS